MTTATRPVGLGKLLTLEQFLARPETKPASEYWAGRVVRKTMPDGLHMFCQKRLLVALERFFEPTPLLEGGPEWRFIFSPVGRRPRALVPDLGYVRMERIFPGALDGSFEGPPDLAVEVLSSEDRPSRVLRKIRFYLDNGVSLVWLVHPRRRTLTVYAPGVDPVVLTERDTLTAPELLPGFAVPVRDILPPLDAYRFRRRGPRM